MVNMNASKKVPVPPNNNEEVKQPSAAAQPDDLAVANAPPEDELG
jgi:hypothetical protein